MFAMEDDGCSEAVVVRMVAPTEQQLDEMAVRKLDCNMEAVSKPSPTLERLVEKRRTRHVRALSDLQNEMLALDTSIKTQVQVEVNDLNKYMEEQTARLDALSSHIQVPDASKHEFEETLQIAKEITHGKKQHITKFSQKVVEFERKRLEQLKNIFKKYYKLVSEIHYEPMYDVQRLFEHKIMVVNQLVLNNLRSYEDIQLQLTQLAHKQLLQLYGQLQLMESTCAARQRELADITVMERTAQLEDFESQFLGTDEGRNVLKLFRAEREQLKILMLEWPDHIGYPPTMDRNCTAELQQVLHNLDSEAKNLVNSYKVAVQQALRDFDNWLKDFHQKLIAENIYDASQSRYLQDKCEKLLKRMETLMNEEVQGFQIQWKNVMEKIDNELQEPLQFLAQGESPWANHMQRVCLAKTLVGKMLEQQLDKGRQAVENKEVEFNITVDNLRQEWQQEILDKALEQVSHILNDLNDLHKSNHHSQAEICDKYRELADTSLQMLMAEIQIFLATYHEKKFNSDIFNELHVLEIPSTIQREMEICKLHLLGVQVWKERMEDVMSRYLTNCEEKLKKEIEKWISDCKKEQQKIHDLIAMVHSTRYDKVKKALYDVRLVEIHTHQQRLHTHHMGIEEHLNELKQHYNKLEGKLENKAAAFEGILFQKETEVNSVTDIGSANYLLNKVEKYFTKFLEDVKLVKQDFQEGCERRVSWLQDSNLNFMKAISLFSEGGNFSANEADYFLKKLNDLNQIIDQEEKNIGKSLSSENSVVLAAQAKYDTLKNRLEVVAEDLQFNREVQKILGKLLSQIRELARTLKQQGNQLGEKVTSAAAGQFELSTDSRWHQLLADISAQIQLLFICDRDNFLPNTDGLFIFQTEETLEVASKVPTGTQTYKDYTNFLSPPTATNETFLMNINKLLWDCLNTMQKTAHNFYTLKETRPVVMLGVIQPDYDSFMVDMLAVFECYHVECVCVWLQEIRELLKTLMTLKNSVTQHAEKSLSVFQENEIHTLQEKQLEILSAFEDIQKNHNLQRGHLNARLRPHYGFPSNKHILDSLTQEMLELSAIHTNDTDTCSVKHLDQLKLTFEEYKHGLLALENVLRSIFGQLFDQSLLPLVVSQTQALCSIIQVSTLKACSNHNGEETNASRFKEMTSSKLNSLPMELSLCDLPRNMNTKQLVAEIHLESDNLSAVLHDIESTAPDTEYVFASKMEEYKLLYHETVKQISNKLLANEENIHSWRTTWENNIQEIEKLYTIRYI